MRDLTKILADLRQEREQIQESILLLERLAGHRRGRPGGGALPSHRRPRVEDGPPRRRRKPGDSDLKS